MVTQDELVLVDRHNSADPGGWNIVTIGDPYYEVKVGSGVRTKW